MICSLAFVPTEDVISAYEQLLPTLPQDLVPVAEHLDYNYIRGKPIRMANRRGPMRRSRPLFDISDWNHYLSIPVLTVRVGDADLYATADLCINPC